jgi:hypothetical protein
LLQIRGVRQVASTQEWEWKKGSSGSPGIPAQPVKLSSMAAARDKRSNRFSMKSAFL